MLLVFLLAAPVLSNRLFFGRSRIDIFRFSLATLGYWRRHLLMERIAKKRKLRVLKPLEVKIRRLVKIPSVGASHLGRPLSCSTTMATGLRVGFTTQRVDCVYAFTVLMPTSRLTTSYLPAGSKQRLLGDVSRPKSVTRLLAAAND